MAADVYLKIEGIPGESTDGEHKDWIELNSFHFDVTQKAVLAPSSANGWTTGRAEFGDVIVTKYPDKATPKLLAACSSGEPVKEATVACYRAGGSSRVKYQEYKLTSCVITRFSPIGSGSLLLEEVSIRYAKIASTYIQQKRGDGSGGGQITGGWDLGQNKKL